MWVKLISNCTKGSIYENDYSGRIKDANKSERLAQRQERILKSSTKISRIQQKYKFY